MTTFEAQYGVAYLLTWAACLTVLFTWLAKSSERTCRTLVVTWVLVLCVYGGWVSAFDLAINCDWDAISEMFGWCVPCAYYYYYGTLGCA
jgi:hypothetical protein